jgi:hypothetical protein
MFTYVYNLVIEPRITTMFLRYKSSTNGPFSMAMDYQRVNPLLVINLIPVLMV